MPKFCPFGFFSFYINKQASQAGGCHRCLENDCSLWEELEDEHGNVYGQCAILSISDSLRASAENSNQLIKLSRSSVNKVSSESLIKDVDESNLLREDITPDLMPSSPNISQMEPPLPSAPPASLIDIFKKMREDPKPLPSVPSTTIEPESVTIPNEVINGPQ